MKKTERLQIRIDPKMKDVLKQLAELHGETVSSYVETLIIRDVARDEKLYRSCEEEVEKNCPNLSQGEKEMRIQEMMYIRRTTADRLNSLALRRWEERISTYEDL